MSLWEIGEAPMSWDRWRMAPSLALVRNTSNPDVMGDEGDTGFGPLAPAFKGVTIVARPNTGSKHEQSFVDFLQPAQ